MGQIQTTPNRLPVPSSREVLEELIRRHLDLVYSSALRQVRDPHLAEDVTQAVFLVLTQKLQTIQKGVAVAGWLLAVTRRASVDAMRIQAKHRRHERALAKPESVDAEVAEWEQIASALDQSLNQLGHKDRDAIVLRFFQGLSLAQVGAELGIAEDAARMRVQRGLARLRGLLSRRGVLAGEGALAAAIPIHAVQAAPSHLLSLTLAGSVSKSVAAIAKGAANLMAWENAKLAALIVLVALIASAGGASILTYALGHQQPADRTTFATVDLFIGDAPPAESPPVPRTVLRPAEGSAHSFGMSSDVTGNVYASGDTWDPAGKIHGIVRQKASGQSAWTTILDLPTRINCVAVSAVGDVYVGSAGDVFKRAVGQQTFPKTPIFRPPPGRLRGDLWGIATDADGNVYVAVNAKGHWVVIKQSLGAGDFNIVDDFVADHYFPDPMLKLGDGTDPNEAFGITVVGGSGPSAGVYVVGNGKFASTDSTRSPVIKGHWLVRRSTDSGNTWSTVDDFVGDSSQNSRKGNSSAQAVCADPAGNIYVVGWTMLGRTVPDGPAGFGIRDGHWTTRKSPTGDANSWSVDDDFVLSKNFPDAAAFAAGVDRAGNVYVVGGSVGDSGGYGTHAIIRTNASGTWQTIDDYQPMSSRSRFQGFAVDSEGRLYASGWAEGLTNGWIVRSAMPTAAKGPGP